MDEVKTSNMKDKSTDSLNFVEEGKSNEESLYVITEEDSSVILEDNSSSFKYTLIQGTDPKRCGTFKYPNQHGNNKLRETLRNFAKCQKIVVEKISLRKRRNSFYKLVYLYEKMFDNINNDYCDYFEDKKSNSFSSDDSDEDNSKEELKENEKKNQQKQLEKFKKLVSPLLPLTTNTNLRKSGIRSKSFCVEKGMSVKYIEEIETNEDIIQFKGSNKLKLISLNLLLKKLVCDKDFLINYALNINHFCLQCFCFLKKDILFKKIDDCFDYYRKKGYNWNKMKNLIDFLGILIIEMYDYYKIIKKEDLVVIRIIKKTYSNIIQDLINSIKINKKILQKGVYNSEFFGNNLYYQSKKNLYKSIKNLPEDNKKENLNMINMIINKIFDKELNNNQNITNLNEEDEIIRKAVTQEEEEFNKDKMIKYHRQSVNIQKIEKPDNINQLANEIIIQKLLYGNSCFRNENKILSNFLSDEEYKLININSILNILENEECSISNILSAKKNILFYEALKNYEINETKLTHSKQLNIIKSEQIRTKNRKYKQEGMFSIFDYEPNEIGDTLIKRTKNLLIKIERKELYCHVFLKKEKKILCPNLCNFIDKMNKLFFFIIEDILSYDKAKERAKVIEKWAQVAEYCKEKNDFNDCLTIVSTFNNYIITGLKQTQDKISNKGKNIINNLRNFCSLDGNYKIIRDEIKKIIKKRETFYPYLGLLMKDIVFNDEKEEYLIDQEKINFEKIENIQSVIDHNFNCKIDFSIIQTNIPELRFFENLDLIQEDEKKLDEIANKLEPNFTLSRYEGFKRKTEIDIKYFEKYDIFKKKMKSSTNILKIHV